MITINNSKTSKTKLQKKSQNLNAFHVEIEHVQVGLYGLLRTLRWITKITILQAKEQMLD